MIAPLLILTGTGTGIGKTHVAAVLLEAWGARAAVAGFKPIESGFDPASSDCARLATASTFHVQPPPVYAFGPPLSPHLAARESGVTIEVSRVTEACSRLRAQADGVVLELPGGLFSPLGPELCNLDLALALRPSALVLVAPDRLGVLHDVGSTFRAAAAERLTVEGVVLSAPQLPDPSTGRNAAEIPVVAPTAAVLSLPRAPVRALAASDEVRAFLDGLLRSERLSPG